LIFLNVLKISSDFCHEAETLSLDFIVKAALLELYLCSKGTNCSVFIEDKGKGKAIPLQAWTGPEDSRRLRLPDFKTVVT
jgi:hypothetical protein